MAASARPPFNKLVVVVTLLCLALLSFEAEAGRSRSLQSAGPPETIFDVVKYGAEPDGETDNLESFMKAWVAACHWRGPTRLLIPKGTFLVGQVAFQGPCNSPTPIVVEVQGTVLAQTDITEYPSPEWFSFEHIDGLVIIGKGTFDGQGKEVWGYNDCHHNKDCQMFPTSLKFTEVNNGHLEGLTSINSMGFHMALIKCNNFTIQHVTITAPEDSPNTDGIHISRSNDVTVSDSNIGTGDDCLSVVRGANNVFITRINCGPGHGISVGSLGKYKDEDDVKGVIVTNCTLTGTTNGARIKTWPDSPPSKASTLHFEDLVMNMVRNPIIIDQAYCPSSSCKNRKPSRIQISDVRFKNIRGTSASKVAVTIMCSPVFPCKDVELFDINLAVPDSEKSDDDDGDKKQKKHDDDDGDDKKKKKKKHDDDDDKKKKKNDNDDDDKKEGAQCLNAQLHYGGIQVPPPCH